MRTVRLRHVTQINPPCPAFDRLSSEDRLTFLPMESVWPGDRLDLSETRLKSEVATGYTRFQDGDVLVPKITPTFEASRSVLVSNLLNRAGAGTTELHVLRAGPDIDSRYLLYNMHSHAFLKLGEAEMYGVAGQKRVPDDFLRNLSVALPTLDEQRRIADFLDAETARIDQLAALRKEQDASLVERETSALESLFASYPQIHKTRVKFLLATRPRYGVLVPEFVDEGVPFIRVNELIDTKNKIDRLNKIPLKQSVQYKRTIVRPGDVLLSVVGTMGRCIVAPPELKGANIARAVASLRMRKGVSADLFASWLHTSEFNRQALLATGSDTAQPTLGMEDLSNFSLSWPRSEQVQREMASSSHTIRQQVAEARHLLNRQLSLLAERRQSLITAAVTGQLDVTTAGRAAVG